MEHAPPLALEELARGPASVEDNIRKFWVGHLIGRIAAAKHEVAPEPPPFVTKWNEAPADPAHWLPALADPARLIPWLDELESALAARNQTLVITYDHLDKIGVRSRDIRRRVLPPLLALWLSLSNRYRRVRAKIFLRRDLFAESVANTADVSKLLARSETLRCERISTVSSTRPASGDPRRPARLVDVGKVEARSYSSRAARWMPPEDLPAEGKPSQHMLMAHIVGERMGSGTDPRSGYSWTWVPNHLKDAQGIIAPRSMITLFKSAASHALNVTPSGKFMRLLAPEELKEGLRETSRRRVDEMQEEHPVIMRLELLKDISLPASLADVVPAFSKVSDKVEDDFGSAGESILDELARLGVVHPLPKDRLDIPDIYRLRFKIGRRGQKVTTGR